MSNPRIYANISFTSKNGVKRRFATQRIDQENIDRMKQIPGLESMAGNMQMLLDAVEEERMGPGEDYPVTLNIGVEGVRVSDEVAL